MSGALWAVAAGVGFGVFQTLNRRAVQGMDVYVATFLQLLISALVLAAASLVTENLALLSQASIWAWINFSLAGFFHFFIGWTLLNANLLDERAKIPDYKVCGVKVERAATIPTSRHGADIPLEDRGAIKDLV